MVAVTAFELLLYLAGLTALTANMYSFLTVFPVEYACMSLHHNDELFWLPLTIILMLTKRIRNKSL